MWREVKITNRSQRQCKSKAMSSQSSPSTSWTVWRWWSHDVLRWIGSCSSGSCDYSCQCYVTYRYVASKISCSWTLFRIILHTKIAYVTWYNTQVYVIRITNLSEKRSFCTGKWLCIICTVSEVIVWLFSLIGSVVFGRRIDFQYLRSEIITNDDFTIYVWSWY